MLGVVRFSLCIVFSVAYIWLLGLAILFGVATMPKRGEVDPFLKGLWRWLSDTKGLTC